MVNPFFKNTGPYDLNYLLKAIRLNDNDIPNDKINDIKDLNSCQNNEITFFHSKLKHPTVLLLKISNQFFQILVGP